MKTIMHNKVKFLMMIFLALSFTVYSVPVIKSNSVPVIKSNKDSGGQKHEFRSLKGQCKCYKQKVYNMPKKHSKSQKKVNRSNR
jgi:hypothetical protein